VTVSRIETEPIVWLFFLYFLCSSFSDGVRFGSGSLSEDVTGLGIWYLQHETIFITRLGSGSNRFLILMSQSHSSMFLFLSASLAFQVFV
jgi:hypothetical protein